MNTHANTRSPAPRMALHARTAHELMTANPLSIRATATVAAAAAFLSGRGISAAPVIDEAGRPVGVVSRSDLLTHRVHRELHRMDASNEGPLPVSVGCSSLPPVEQSGQARVRDVMTPAVFCVRSETSAGKVVEKMLALQVRRLFVVDGDGILVGVISAFDVMRHLRPQGTCGSLAAPGRSS